MTTLQLSQKSFEPPTFIKQEGLRTNQADDLDLPTDLKGRPIKINWGDPPPQVSVPGVDIHSLILDFSAVSFLDISAVKGLKAVQLSHFLTLDYLS